MFARIGACENRNSEIHFDRFTSFKLSRDSDVIYRMSIYLRHWFIDNIYRQPSNLTIILSVLISRSLIAYNGLYELKEVELGFPKRPRYCWSPYCYFDRVSPDYY